MAQAKTICKSFFLPYPCGMEIKTVIERAGGIYAVAEASGLTRQAIEHWVKTGVVPAERVLALAEMASVRPSEIRPDIYPEGLVA